MEATKVFSQASADTTQVALEKPPVFLVQGSKAINSWQAGIG